MTKKIKGLPGNQVSRNGSTLLMLAVSCFVLGVLPGCGKEDAQYVEVQAMDKPAAVKADNPVPEHAMMGQESTVPFKYTLPEGWAVVDPRPMQLLTVEAGQANIPANVSVSAFPGDVGGQVANINRWRRQIGLGPVSAEAAKELIQPVTITGLEGWQVDMTGAAPEMDDHGAARLVVSAVSHGGQTWFFKLVGAQSSVEPELEHYKAFIESISF